MKEKENLNQRAGRKNANPIGVKNQKPRPYFLMFLKPFTKKLKEVLESSYNFDISDNFGYYSKYLSVHDLKCSIHYLRFPDFVVTTGDNPDSMIGRVNLNIIEKIYLWGTLRDKILEIERISHVNSSRQI